MGRGGLVLMFRGVTEWHSRDTLYRYAEICRMLIWGSRRGVREGGPTRLSMSVSGVNMKYFGCTLVYYPLEVDNNLVHSYGTSSSLD
jgi:hypothetical protein